MEKRFYLDSDHRPEGTIWYTLVFENPTTYFVERFNDSVLSFLTGRVKKIRPSEFNGQTVNGVRLAELVETKLKEIDNASCRLQV